MKPSLEQTGRIQSDWQLIAKTEGWKFFMLDMDEIAHASLKTLVESDDQNLTTRCKERLRMIEIIKKRAAEYQTLQPENPKRPG